MAIKQLSSLQMQASTAFSFETDIRLRRTAASVLTLDDGAAGAANFSATGNILTNAAVDFLKIATPANPAAGRMKLYFKADGNLYKLNEGGTETAIAGSGASSATTTAQGLVQLATQAQSFAATPDTESSEPLVVQPSGLLLRRDLTSNVVLYTQDLNGFAPSARTASGKTLEIMTVRSAVDQVIVGTECVGLGARLKSTAGTGSILIGSDLTSVGNALIIGKTNSVTTNTNLAVDAVMLGRNNTVSSGSAAGGASNDAYLIGFSNTVRTNNSFVVGSSNSVSQSDATLRAHFSAVLGSSNTIHADTGTLSRGTFFVGNSNTTCTGELTGTARGAFGYNNTLIGNGSFAIGVANDFNGVLVSGENYIVGSTNTISSNTSPANQCYIFGRGSTIHSAPSNGSTEVVSIGTSNTSYANLSVLLGHSCVLGDGTTSRAQFSVNIGYGNTIKQTAGGTTGGIILIGSSNTAENTTSGSSGVVGFNNTGIRASNYALGETNTFNTGTTNVWFIGRQNEVETNTIPATDSYIFGRLNTIRASTLTANSSSNCYVIGQSNIVRAISTFVAGDSNTLQSADGGRVDRGVVIGYNNTVGGNTSSVSGVIVVGNSNTTPAVGSGNAAVIVGRGNTNAGLTCFAFGSSNVFNSTTANRAYGFSNSFTAGSTATYLFGDNNTAGASAGAGNANGDSHAFGESNTVNALGAHAFGTLNVVDGNNSTAIGYANDIGTALGNTFDVTIVVGTDCSTISSAAATATVVAQSGRDSAVFGRDVYGVGSGSLICGYDVDVNATSKVNVSTNPNAVSRNDTVVFGRSIVMNQTTAVNTHPVGGVLAMGSNIFIERGTEQMFAACRNSIVGKDVFDVRVASTANIDLTTGGLLTIDGITLAAGNLVLVKNQTTASQNGIYTVAVGTWTRSTSFDTDAEIRGHGAYATEGTTNGGSAWVNTNATTITVGSTSITYAANEFRGITNVGFFNHTREELTVACGSYNFATAAGSLAIGYLNNDDRGDPQDQSTGRVATHSVNFGPLAGVGINSIAMGADNRGLALNATAVGRRNTVGNGATGNGNYGQAFGIYNILLGDNTVGLGINNFSTTTSLSAVSIGSFNNTSRAGYTLDDSTGIVTAIASAVTAATIGINSTAVGIENIASALNSTAIGRRCDATGIRSTALGYKAVARLTNTINIGGINILRKDNAEVPATIAARVATTANITLSAPQTIDGVSVIAGNRVLVKDQTTASENGVYVVAAGAWTRATDSDIDSELRGRLINVTEGATYTGYTFQNTNESPITVGTTSLTYEAGSDYEVKAFTGQHVTIMSEELNLETLQTVMLRLPTGSRFYVEEVGVMATNIVAIAIRPTISFGIAGNNDFYLADTLMDDLSANYDRERFTTLASSAGTSTLTAQVTVIATGTTVLGRVYWRGILVEEE